MTITQLRLLKMAFVEWKWHFSSDIFQSDICPNGISTRWPVFKMAFVQNEFYSKWPLFKM